MTTRRNERQKAAKATSMHNRLRALREGAAKQKAERPSVFYAWIRRLESHLITLEQLRVEETQDA